MTNSSLRDEVEEWRIWFWRALTLQYKLNTFTSCWVRAAWGTGVHKPPVHVMHLPSNASKLLYLFVTTSCFPACKGTQKDAPSSCTLSRHKLHFTMFYHHGGLGDGTCSESLGAWGQPGTLQSLGQVNKPSNHEIISLNRRSEYMLIETLIIIFESIKRQIFLV